MNLVETQVMSHDRIYDWLQLPLGHWPPDHYVLLGVPRGIRDPALIEAHAAERLATLRQYQLEYPELATEAMNCVAQAFACLADAAARQRYDASLTPPPGCPHPDWLADLETVERAQPKAAEPKRGTPAPDWLRDLQ